MTAGNMSAELKHRDAAACIAYLDFTLASQSAGYDILIGVHQQRFLDLLQVLEKSLIVIQGAHRSQQW